MILEVAWLGEHPKFFLLCLVYQATPEIQHGSQTNTLLSIFMGIEGYSPKANAPNK